MVKIDRVRQKVETSRQGRKSGGTWSTVVKIKEKYLREGEGDDWSQQCTVGGRKNGERKEKRGRKFSLALMEIWTDLSYRMSFFTS